MIVGWAHRRGRTSRRVKSRRRVSTSPSRRLHASRGASARLAAYSTGTRRRLSRPRAGPAHTAGPHGHPWTRSPPPKWTNFKPAPTGDGDLHATITWQLLRAARCGGSQILRAGDVAPGRPALSAKHRGRIASHQPGPSPVARVEEGAAGYRWPTRTPAFTTSALSFVCPNVPTPALRAVLPTSSPDRVKMWMTAVSPPLP